MIVWASCSKAHLTVYASSNAQFQYDMYQNHFLWSLLSCHKSAESEFTDKGVHYSIYAGGSCKKLIGTFGVFIHMGIYIIISTCTN